MKKTFTKADLRTGDIAVQRDGLVERYMSGTPWGDLFVVLHDRGVNMAYGFNDDLTWDGDSAFDIIEVYRPRERTSVGKGRYTNTDDYRCVFKREEKRIEKDDAFKPEKPDNEIKACDSCDKKAECADSDDKTDLLTLLAEIGSLLLDTEVKYEVKPKTEKK